MLAWWLYRIKNRQTTAGIYKYVYPLLSNNKTSVSKQAKASLIQNKRVPLIINYDTLEEKFTKCIKLK